MKEYIRECNECDKEFIATAPASRYCSDECKKIVNKRNKAKSKSLRRRVCSTCGEEYRPMNRYQRNCSDCTRDYSDPRIHNKNRICRDCGAKTVNYFKCEECWEKKEHGLEANFNAGLYDC